MRPFISLETDFDITTSPSPSGHQWRTRATTRAWLVSATGPQTLAYETSRDGIGDTLYEAQAEAMRAAIEVTAVQILAGPWADTYREIYAKAAP